MGHETLTLVLAVIAVVASLLAYVRMQQVERRCAAREEQSAQRQYRDAVRDYLFISAKYEMVAYSIASRANDLIRGRSVILAELSRSNIPDEITKEVVRNLALLDEPLHRVQKIREHYGAVFQGAKELEQLISSGGPISPQVHDRILSVSSDFERRAYDLKERADAVLQPLEHRFQEYLEELTNTALSTRTLQ
jgi:hypothetical protein